MVPSDSDKAQTASTHWKILARSEHSSLIQLRPKTGRMHQLRAHMKFLGCPILGDRLYGEKDSASRLMLHAARLRLSLPDGADLDIKAPLPEEMAGQCELLGLAVEASEA